MNATSKVISGRKPGSYLTFLAPKMQKIVDFIRDNPDLMQHQIAKGLDISRNTLAGTLHRLKSDGHIKQKEGGYIIG